MPLQQHDLPSECLGNHLLGGASAGGGKGASAGAMAATLCHHSMVMSSPASTFAHKSSTTSGVKPSTPCSSKLALCSAVRKLNKARAAGPTALWLSRLCPSHDRNEPRMQFTTARTCRWYAWPPMPVGGAKGAKERIDRHGSAWTTSKHDITITVSE